MIHQILRIRLQNVEKIKKIKPHIGNRTHDRCVYTYCETITFQYTKWQLIEKVKYSK